MGEIGVFVQNFTFHTIFFAISHRDQRINARYMMNAYTLQRVCLGPLASSKYSTKQVNLV